MYFTIISQKYEKIEHSVNADFGRNVCGGIFYIAYDVVKYIDKHQVDHFQHR